MTLLNPGDLFPRLTINVPGGQGADHPRRVRRRLRRRAVLPRRLVPVLQRAAARPSSAPAQALAEAGVKVAALSVDDEATTPQLIAKHGLTFPVGYGADAPRRRRAHRRLRQPGPGVSAVHRLRARPRGQRRGQRVLQRRHRAARPRRRHRPRPLPARSTRQPRPPDLTGRQHDRRRHPLLLRPGVPVRLDHQQVGAHGRRPAGLRRRLAVHLPADDQLRGRLRQPLPGRLRGRAHLRAAAAAGRGAGPGRARPGRRRPALRGGQQRDLRLPGRRRADPRGPGQPRASSSRCSPRRACPPTWPTRSTTPGGTTRSAPRATRRCR